MAKENLLFFAEDTLGAGATAVYDGVNGTSFPIDSYHGTAQAFTAVDITVQ